MICADCTKGFQLDGETQGTLHGSAYLAAGSTPGRAVVLFADIFGLALKNPKLLADELARLLRVDVWVPDLFGGHPPVTLDELAPHTSPLPGAKKTCWEQVKWYAFLAQKAGALRQVRPAVIDPVAIKFLEKIRRERGYETVGAVGYCFGGSLALRLASSDLIQGAVIAHPGGAPLELVNAIKIPTVWLCAEEDAQFPDAARKAAMHALDNRTPGPAPPHEFVVYPGTTHGFAARPALEHPQIKDAFEKAFAKTAAFLGGLLLGADCAGANAGL